MKRADSDPATSYAKAVVAKRIVAGPYVRKACERHLRDIKEQKARAIRWRPKLAQRAYEFFAEVLVLEGGEPFELLDFQKFIVGSLFGWLKADGFRRFRDAYIEIGKGNGKTPLAAGVGLYALVADNEPAPEVYAAAVTRDQAKICFSDAVRMVDASPELKALIETQVGSLTIPSKKATFRPVSSEHKGLDGLRVHVGIIDELHEHPSAMVVDKIRAGVKRRKNALIFRITNSGYDRTSVCWVEHEFSIQIVEGSRQNDAWFAYVCAIDEGDDFLNDAATWPKANPGLDYGLPPRSYLEGQVDAALGMPSKENIVKRLNGCEWTEQSERWLAMELWHACAGAPVGAKLGAPCFVGFDAASRMDFAAEIKLFGPDAGGVYDLLARFWIPEKTIAADKKAGRAGVDAATGKKRRKGAVRSEADRLLIRSWVDQGFVIATPGNVTDYDRIEKDVLDGAEQYDVQKLAFDRWNVTQLVTHWQDKLGEGRVIDFPQSFQGMSAPTKELEKLITDGKIRHGGNPVLSWMVSNVSIRQGPDEQVKPDRESSKDKIDGVVALVMALGMSIRESEEEESVYDQRAREADLGDAEGPTRPIIDSW